MTREALVKGYAVWPDVFARIFLGMSALPQNVDAEMPHCKKGSMPGSTISSFRGNALI